MLIMELNLWKHTLIKERMDYMNNNQCAQPIDRGVAEAWENYADKFNRLADLMIKADIDVKMLNEVINAAIELHTYGKGSLQVKENEETFEELVDILNKNYYRHNSQFIQELLISLKCKTGNDNLGILCQSIIDNLEKHRDCNENIS